MKKFGLIGGIGPESTAKYYQKIINAYRERLATDEYPDFVIRSINMTEMLRFVFSNDLDGLVRFLHQHLSELQKSGVAFSALASNTPHIVFDQLTELSTLPLISIVEETCEAIKTEGLKKVGLFGTQSTMEAGFYQKNAEKHGIEIVIPEEEHRSYIHKKYFEELVFNKINPATKSYLLEIVNSLKDHSDIQGLILGGTELALILHQSDFADLKIFDTTEIHVEAIVTQMIQG